MLRVLLGLVLLAIAAGLGFFYGRHLNPVPVESNAASTLAPPAPEATRSRSMGEERGPTMPPAPAPVPPVADRDLPPAPPTDYADPGALLAQRNVGLPIAGLQAKDILDTFDDARGEGTRRHEAADIMAERGTPVLAMVDGLVKKLFTSVPGGLTVYQFDAAERYCYYYAHLDRYAAGLREGVLLRRGDLVGYVGNSGNADPSRPHLHLAIFEVGPGKKWWEGNRPLNPYPVLMQALPKQR